MQFLMRRNAYNMMHINLRLLILFLTILAISFGGDQPSLKVSVYYESRCPGSREFITTQLAPGFREIASFIDLELVPFGNSELSNKTGRWKFHCQHGPTECYGNKVQACVIDSYSTQDSLNFVNCAMSSRDAGVEIYLKKCANLTNVSWSSIKDCLSSGKGDDLLAINGRKTDELVPAKEYVPWLLFNDTYDKAVDAEGTEHFLKTACKLLKNKPKKCNFNEDDDDVDTNSI